MTQPSISLRTFRPNLHQEASGTDVLARDGAARHAAAVSALTLAMLCLGVSLVVCPLPLSGHFPTVGLPDPAPPLLQILPTLAATLGVLAGVLGMTTPGSTREPSSNEPSGEDPTGLQEAVADLRALLAQERFELGKLRELSTNGTKEAMLLAERLAGTTLDAEVRLTASVAQAELALRHPNSAATRAAETSIKVERMLSRAEGVLRNLPEATMQREAACVLNAAPPLFFGTDAASSRLPAEWQQELAALRAAGQEISRSAQDAVATLSHAAQSTIGRLTEAIITSVGAMPAGAPERHEVVSLDPTVVARLEMAVSELQHETSGLSAAVARVSALEPMIDQHLSAAALVTEAAGRAEQSAHTVATASQVIVETTDEVVLQIARLAGISGHAETQAAVLPAIAAQMAEAAGRLQAAALNSSPAFDGLTGRLERLDDLSTGIATTIGRVETSLVKQGGTAEALRDGLAQVQSGLANITERFAPEGQHAQKDDLSTLHQIDIVARETALLLRQTEALAEAVVSGQAPSLPPLLAECTPALLAGVETTIVRLRSVATALALASDGPPAKQNSAFYASGNPARV